jgi:hypothetical protein
LASKGLSRAPEEILATGFLPQDDGLDGIDARKAFDAVDTDGGG